MLSDNLSGQPVSLLTKSLDNLILDIPPQQPEQNKPYIASASDLATINGSSVLSMSTSLESSANNVIPTTIKHFDKQQYFDYDPVVYSQLIKYIQSNNHHGLALISRQKGIPPFLRFKVWPVLLKYHAHVRNPFIQPDNDISSNNEDDEETLENKAMNEEEISAKIKKDLKKYIQRLTYSSQIELNENEQEIFHILESAILKFTIKWSKIIKYDQSLTWMALNLAEWFPPIPNTPWVLCGRDNTSSTNNLITDITQDYSQYIDESNTNPEIQDFLAEENMKFSSVYERLVLVLLHSPLKKSEVQNKALLPINGGTIEERVSFFIYGLRKLLPELGQFFSEEQILTRFGSHDDEWLIWWLKFGGSKVWSKFDRGRIWDLIFGWRLKNPKKPIEYYVEKLEVDNEFLSRIGSDVFWSLNSNDLAEFKDPESLDNETRDAATILHKNSSFKNLVEELSSSKSSIQLTEHNIPFSKLDPQFELIFVSLAILKSKENILVELDQHEIRQFLSRLPTKSYKSRKRAPSEDSSESSANFPSPIASANNTPPKKYSDAPMTSTRKSDYLDNVIDEAGELWRKWLQVEMSEET
jgi:hypothetical protein